MCSTMNARDFFYRHDQLVIFDTEFTTWEGAMERGWSGDYEHREIVQIAAQKIDLKNEAVIESFERLVRPQVNPDLSQYFQELTGITQVAVDEHGVDFTTMYTEFSRWADGLTKYAYGKRVHEPADVAVLQENIALYELDLTLDTTEYGNLAAVYQSVGIDTSAYSSGELYRAFGLELDGHVHNAMHDVTSLVESLFATKRILLA